MSAEPRAWDTARLDAATGKGVRVLLADSGVETDHPALRGAAVSCWGVQWTPGVAPCVVGECGGDAAGHGTAAAWILHQYAPEAELHSVRVLGPSLRGASELLLAALRWGVRQGYDIINCSFGTSCQDFLGDYKRLVDSAFCRNVWLVAASSAADFRGEEEYPAHFPTVLATDFARLEGLALRRRRGRLVEFVAAGEGLRVPWRGGGYRTVSGSSFAAPHLAALAARLRQVCPTWNACEAKAALYALAEEAPG